MDFDEYSANVCNFAMYPNKGTNLVYPAMGLVGKSGELCDKIKKHWRNCKGSIDPMSAASLTVAQHKAIIEEMGDVLWYLNALANELNVSLEQIAMTNILKLQDRAVRGVIKGEGDNR